MRDPNDLDWCVSGYKKQGVLLCDTRENRKVFIPFSEITAVYFRPDESRIDMYRRHITLGIRVSADEQVFDRMTDMFKQQ